MEDKANAIPEVDINSKPPQAISELVQELKAAAMNPSEPRKQDEDEDEDEELFEEEDEDENATTSEEEDDSEDEEECECECEEDEDELVHNTTWYLFGFFPLCRRENRVVRH